MTYEFITGVPAMVPGVRVDENTININGNSVTLTLRWEQPFSYFYPIQHYTGALSCSHHPTCPLTFITTRRSHTITNLILMTTYRFSVVAINAIGSGDAGVVMITIPKGDIIYYHHHYIHTYIATTSTVGVTTSTSSVGMTTSTSSVSMTTSTSSVDMTTSTSSVSMTTSTSSVGMTTSTSSVGMTTSTSSVGMTTSTSSVGMTTSTSSVGMTTSTSGMTTSTSSVGMTTSTSSVGMTTSTSSVGTTIATVLLHQVWV